jgi:hypothetical protein
VIAAAISLAVAVSSLALPSGPSYDQYAWLIWGRDLAHGTLSVGGSGTSWKPLPSIIDALFAPLGSGATDAWLVIARAGALFAVFMAFRLAWRLAQDRLRALAGVIAAASLVLTHEWVRRNGVGNAEGLMVAFGLLAIDRHMDRRHGQAFALLVLAGLIRVEMWPFAAAYGAWLAWRSTARVRVELALGALLIPLLWFGGDWVGSGSLTTASGRALHPIAGSPGASAHPIQAVAVEAYLMLPLPVWIAIAAALLLALARRRIDAVVALAGLAAGWTAVVALMAQRGYPGLPRFLFMASALDAVASGVGAAVVVGAFARIPGAVGSRGRDALTLRTSRPIAVAGALLTCAAFAFGAAPAARLLPTDVAGVDKVADMDASLAHSVQAAGGADAVMDCGSPTTPWYTVTALAYDLGVPATDVHDRPEGARPVVFKLRRGNFRVSETGSCRLLAAKAPQVRHRAAGHQHAHDRRDGKADDVERGHTDAS